MNIFRYFFIFFLFSSPLFAQDPPFAGSVVLDPASIQALYDWANYFLFGLSGLICGFLVVYAILRSL